MPSELVFPHLTDYGPAPNHHEVEAKYEEVFALRVEEGVVRPFVFPYFFYGLGLLFVYLCIPHTHSPVLYAARWPVATTIILFQLKVLLETSSGNVGVAALAGGASGLIIVLTSTWLVCCKPQFEAKRVQRRKKENISGKRGKKIEKPLSEKDDNIIISDQSQKYELDMPIINDKRENIVLFDRGKSPRQRRRVENGESDREITARTVPLSEMCPSELEYGCVSSGEQDEFEFYWEKYPDSLLERIPWVIDLLYNTRGAGWNWAIPTIPDLPDFVKHQLGEPGKQYLSKRTCNRILPSTRALIRYRLPQLAICYLLLDANKTLQMKDPYFVFGPCTYELPSHLKNLSPYLVWSYRYIFSCTFGFAVPLQFAFVLQDLALSLIGPRLLGVVAEPWRLPTTWGSPMAVLNSGLGGFWGNLWHQRLRIFFSTPVDYLIERRYLTEGSVTAKLTGRFIAFAISGFIHACISIAQFQHTNPWWMFIFFILHALGIIFQTSFCVVFHPWLVKIPKSIRQIGNFVFTFTWFRVTGPLFADDVARGGSWLNEAVPVSLFRGLGLGVEGDGWWCWSGYIRGSWYRGKHWWESGLAL
jgi:hypothetical protein